MAKAKVLSKDEIKRVMRIADSGSNGARDKLALSLSILAGMRVGEIAALTIGDVRGIDGQSVEIIHLTKHQTKGNRSRRVFVGDDLQKLLNAYLGKRSKLSDEIPLIRSTRTGGHFSNVSLSLRMKAIYRSAGIDTSSHAGRRTFATRKNEVGIGMRTIQQLLGHANIQTTAMYCDVSDDQLRGAANAG
ncbi:MAG: integrase [Alphaproteobacteria bacterium PA2]|nr:MAG: integrase [Alphaproteobacteria bacterium PA2]